MQHIDRRTFLQMSALMSVVGTGWAQSSVAAARAIGFNHVTLKVSDVETAREFYEPLLGKVGATSDDRERIDFVNVRGEYLSLQRLQEGRPRIDHLCLSVQDFDRPTLEKVLREMGADVLGVPGNDPWVLFHDLAGNLMQLMAPNQPRPEGLPARGRLGASFAFNHATYYTSKLEDTRAFYERLHGESRRLTDPPGFSITLSDRGEYFYFGSRSADRSEGIDHICLSVEGYEREATAKQLKSLGIEVEEAGRADQVFFRDPDGILILLTSPESRN